MNTILQHIFVSMLLEVEEFGVQKISKDMENPVLPQIQPLKAAFLLKKTQTQTNPKTNKQNQNQTPNQKE